jgi:PhnB protein
VGIRRSARGLTSVIPADVGGWDDDVNAPARCRTGVVGPTHPGADAPDRQETTVAQLNPYISFRSEAREAMEFYQRVFGGELALDTFASYEGMVQDPSENDLIMHAQLTTPDGFVLMAADTPTGMDYVKPAGISVSVSGDDEARLDGFWNALADGGSVVMPFEVPPWGGRFGMLRDKYDIDWMISYSPAS